MSRRALLGAHVQGPAAAWLSARIHESDVAASVAHFRGVGRADVAVSIESAVAQIREAARAYDAWRGAGVSGGGSAEVPLSGRGAGSSRGVVDTSTAAAALGVTERRVRQLLEAELLDGRKAGGRWVVDGEDLERLCEDRRLTA